MRQRLLLALVAAMLLAGCTSNQHSGPIEAGENIAVVSTQHGDVRGYIDAGEPPTHGFSVQNSAHKSSVFKGLKCVFERQMRITSG